MIIGYIKGQELQLKSELIVADTIDYLTAKFVFKTADWQGLSKWAHFKKGSTVYDIQLTSDSIKKSDHLNLAEGEWEVYLHGNAFEGGEVVERITTEVAKIAVKGTGLLNGEPFPEIPASESEQIEAKLADHEERIEALEEGGGGGGAVSSVNGKTGAVVLNAEDVGALPDDTPIPTKTSDLENDSGFLTEHQSLAGYATEQYVQNYHDNTKQDVISDLATIRSGAALGATALQSVPNTYRTASAQDVIDNGKVDKVTGKGLSTNDYTNADKAKVDSAVQPSDLPAPEVFTAIYGTTTFAEVVAANNAGKKVQCIRNASGTTYLYDLTLLSETVARFGQLSNASIYTASLSSDNAWSRADTAMSALAKTADVVAISQGVAHANEFLVVGADGNVTTKTLEAWQGGSY